MWIETSFSCAECYTEHPIEFRVLPDGRIETQPMPLIEDVYPCIQDFRKNAERINLSRFEPITMVGVLLNIICAITKCLRPTEHEKRIVIETETDHEILAGMFRHARTSTFLVLQKNTPTIVIDEYVAGIIERILEWGLDHPTFLAELTRTMAWEIETHFAYVAISQLMENTRTANVTRSVFRDLFRTLMAERIQQPIRSIDSNYIYLWCERIMPISPDDALWTLDSLIELLLIKRAENLTLNCYWPLRGEAVSRCRTIIARSPIGWNPQTLEQLADKLEQFLKLEQEVFPTTNPSNSSE